MRSSPNVVDSARPAFTAAIITVILVWLVTVTSLMVTDVWDESRALNLFQGNSFLELVTSNWKQAGATGLVLFRPLPFLLFSGIAKLIGNPDLIWRVLRSVNAALVLASVALVLAVVRRLGNVNRVRDVELSVALLWSGSAVITAGWFANGFDAMALFCIALSLHELTRNRGTAAGLVLGLAFFCKEVAILAVPFVFLLLWLGAVDRRETTKTIAVAAGGFVVFLVFRTMVVLPGSAADLRHFSLDGVFPAFLRLSETIWWQVADVPVRWLGTIITLASLVLMRRRRAAVALALLLMCTAVLYGPIVHLGPSLLLSADNFAGRLYLVPATLALVLVALYGRRHAIVLLLVPILWGAGFTASRHFQFQQAYLVVYEKAACVKKPPLRVLCRFSKDTFRNEFRRVAFGHFPNARWLLKADGTLVRRPGKFDQNTAP